MGVHQQNGGMSQSMQVCEFRGRRIKLLNARRGFLGSISTADGSALVRLGNTTVVCGVKAEIAEPELDLPDNGFIGTACLERCLFIATL